MHNLYLYDIIFWYACFVARVCDENGLHETEQKPFERTGKRCHEAGDVADGSGGRKERSLKEIVKTRSGAPIPQITPEQAESRHYLTRSLLSRMHLIPEGDPIAYTTAEDGSVIYYFDPQRVVEAPPETWYAPAIQFTETMTLPNGNVIGRMSTKRAASCGYYTKERLSQMHYDVVEEPVAYTLRNDKSVIYFYDKTTAIRQPLMCVECGKDVRYRRKLCKACFDADMAIRRVEGDAHRSASYGMKRERVIFFDLELTGVYDHDEIISISILDGNGTLIMDTLVKPAHTKKWKKTEKIHGITPEMVADAPLLKDLIPRTKEIFENADAIIAYGISTDFSHIKYIYDTQAERDALREKTRCAANEYVRFIQEHHPELNHASLGDAMECLGVAWEGVAHTSIADTIGCAKVWEKLFPNYYEN